MSIAARFTSLSRLIVVSGCPLAQAQARRPFSHIRLQPRALSKEYCGRSALEHNDYVRRLKSLQPDRNIRFEVMQDRLRHAGYWETRIRRDWDRGLGSSPSWWTGDEELEDGDAESESYSEDDELGELPGFAHWM